MVYAIDTKYQYEPIECNVNQLYTISLRKHVCFEITKQ